MKTVFSDAMRHATKLARAQNVVEATQVIQRALSEREHHGRHATECPQLIAPPIDDAEMSQGVKSVTDYPRLAQTRSGEATTERGLASRMKGPLGEVLKLLRLTDVAGAHQRPASFVKSRKTHGAPIPAGAAYLTRTFSCAAGPRDYKVYVPSQSGAHARPLIVMLHGCTQDPDDFAAGTGMKSARGGTRLHRRLSETATERQSGRMLELVRRSGSDARGW